MSIIEGVVLCVSMLCFTILVSMILVVTAFRSAEKKLFDQAKEEDRAALGRRG